MTNKLYKSMKLQPLFTDLLMF